MLEGRTLLLGLSHGVSASAVLAAVTSLSSLRSFQGLLEFRDALVDLSVCIVKLLDGGLVEFLRLLVVEGKL